MDPAPRFLLPALRSTAAVALLGTSGCDFFHELKDKPQEEDTDGSGSGSDSGGSGSDGVPLADTDCTAIDDQCLDQDSLASCSPTDGQLRLVDCNELCGQFINVTCVGTQTGQHACWCTEPGPAATLPCFALEQCIQPCSTPACADDCFARAVTNTVRLYGALLHCGNEECDALCRDDPAMCGACVQETVALGHGQCSVLRALCDADESDEPFWP